MSSSEMHSEMKISSSSVVKLGSIYWGSSVTAMPQVQAYQKLHHIDFMKQESKAEDEFTCASSQRNNNKT